MNKKLIGIALCLFCIGAGGVRANEAPITDEAQKLYQKHKKSVYQVRTVSKTSGKKSAIGSGFQFTPDGHIATNYHVIADAIQRPRQFYIECIRFDNTVHRVEVVDIDTIHDLAIVKMDVSYETFFQWDTQPLQKGTKIFAMGNPYDLSMSIVEGIYNGLMKKSLYRKILFSGALNSGMSGGPAFNRDGEVIGINVSTKGNDVSFLVPVSYLETLFTQTQSLKQLPVRHWDTRIENQLVANQESYVNDLMNRSWDSLPIGDAKVPGEISSSFRCWSDSEPDKTNLYDISYISCFTDDVIFIDSDFYTGKISYQYNWVTSQGLNPVRFYNLYERIYSYLDSYENARKKDVGNFTCNTDFVKIDQVDSKVAFCARPYKKYPRLFDINVSVASVHENDRGLIVVLKALGLSQKSALRVTRKFLNKIQWKK